MSLNIKSERADRLARELASRTGESITEAVTTAIEDRLARLRPRVVALSDLVARFGALAVLDNRSPEEILGYDADGLPV